jgi:hypothetical protein
MKEVCSEVQRAKWIKNELIHLKNNVLKRLKKENLIQL